MDDMSTLEEYELNDNEFIDSELIENDLMLTSYTSQKRFSKDTIRLLETHDDRGRMIRRIAFYTKNSVAKSVH